MHSYRYAWILIVAVRSHHRVPPRDPTTGRLVPNATRFPKGFAGLADYVHGLGVQFGDGLRFAGGGVIRLQVRFADVNGGSATSLSVATKGGCAAGDVKRYQIWYRDPATTPCGAQFNLSNGYEITWEA